MKKTLKIIIYAIIFGLIISLKSNAYAVTASFSVSPASKSIGVGKSTTITITAKNCGGRFNISSSNSDIATVSSTSEWVETGSKKITIKAKKIGTTTIIINPTNVANTDGNDVALKPKTVTIKVTDSSNNNTNNNDNKNDDNKENSKKSTNANLSTLGVTPKEYDFTGFNKDKTSYSVTVPSSVDKLNVAYKTADSKATAKVTGNTNLEVGTNNIKVVVTAEDGKTTKTYTIKVTKLATEDEKPGNIIDDDKDLDICLTSLSLKNLEITPAFASDVYSYEATINMDEKDFSDVVVNAVANDEKATIEITGNTNLVEGENLINVIVKSSNGNEKVYQITVNKVSQKSEVVSSGKIKKEHLIIGAYVFVLVIIFAVIIIKHIRNKKYEYEEDDETFDDTQEIDLNDTAEETHDNFIEELYKKRNNGEELQKDEKEIMEDIEEENDRIFNKPKEGSTVEYDQNEIIEEKKEELLEDLRKKRKGKHF